MSKLSDLEYLRLSRGGKFLYRLRSFFASIPEGIAAGCAALGGGVKRGVQALGEDCREIGATFREGEGKTKVSFLLMGFGSVCRGQVLRGLLFFLFEVVFLFYMFTAGGHWLSLLPSLGKVGPTEVYDPVLDTFSYQ